MFNNVFKMFVLSLLIEFHKCISQYISDSLEVQKKSAAYQFVGD